MAKLSEFRSDTRAINDGIWIHPDKARYPDLEILTRGFSDEYIDAQQIRLAAAAEKQDGLQSRIPNAERRQINAALLRDFLVLDVRGLENDDGTAVSRDDFLAALDKPEYSKLQQACFAAAARVTSRSAEQIKGAAGN